jgi:hypothetical protein
MGLRIPNEEEWPHEVQKRSEATLDEKRKPPSWLEDLDQRRQGAMQLSLDSAEEINQDRAIRAINVRTLTGLPDEFIDADLDGIEQDLKAGNFRIGGKFSLRKFALQAPSFARWMSQSKFHGALTPEEFSNIADIEEMARRPMHLWRLPDETLKQQSRLAAMRRSEQIWRETEQRPMEMGVPGGLIISTKVSRARGASSIKQLEEQLFREELSQRRWEEDFIAKADRVGFWEKLEARFRENPLLLLPFLGGLPDAEKAAQLYHAAKAMEDGKASEEQMDMLIRFGRLAEAAERRGIDVFGITGAILAELPAFALEMASTAGVVTIVKGAVTKGGKAAATSFLRRTVNKVVKNKLVGNLSGIATQAALTAPIRVSRTTIERMTPAGYAEMEDGSIVYNIIPETGESFSVAFPKALWIHFSEVASEHFSRLPGLSKVDEIFNKGINKVLFGWRKTKVPGETAAGFQKFLQAAAIGGVPGEMAEEEVNKLLVALGGIEPYRLPTGEELAAEAMAFLVPGVTGAALGHIGPKPKPISDPQILRTLGKSLQKSLLAGKAPQEMERLIKDDVRDTPNEFAYINFRRFADYFSTKVDEEGNPVDPANIYEEMTGETKGYTDSEKTGIDLVVPMERYLMTIGKSEHNDAVAEFTKLSPSEVTPEENADPVPEGIPEPPTTVPIQPEDAGDPFTALAEAQRGEPEYAMRQIQQTRISAGYDFLVEETGDLTYRMSDKGDRESAGYAAVNEKVVRILGKLTAAERGLIPVEDDLVRQIKSNVEYAKETGREVGTVEQEYSNLKNLGQRYADAHRKLPVFNKAQELARDAAIAIGEFRFDDARKLLRQLQDIINKGPDAWVKAAHENDPTTAKSKREAEKQSIEDQASWQAQWVERNQYAHPIWVNPRQELPPKLATQFERAVEDHRQETISILREKLQKDKDKLQVPSEDLKKELAKVRRRIEEHVNAQREYIAMSILEFGTLPDGTPVAEALGTLKLSRELLKKEYGDDPKLAEYLKRIPKRMMTTKAKGGVHADYAAEVLGFESGAALIEMIATTPRRVDAINRAVREAKEGLYPNLIKSGQISDDAVEAVYNDQYDKQLERAQRIMVSKDYSLFKKIVIAVTGRVKSKPELRADAAEILEGMEARRINPHLFSEEARRNGKAVVKAALEGRYQDMFDTLAMQRLNVELYRQSLRAKKEIDSIPPFMRRYTKSQIRAIIRYAGADYLEQIDDLLNRFEFRNLSEAKRKSAESLAAWIVRQREAGYNPVIDPDLERESFKKYWKNLTLAQLRDIRNAVKNIEKLARLKNKLLASKEEREFDATITGITDRMVEARPTPKEITVDPPSNRLASYAAMHRRLSSLIREMDNFQDGGPFWEAVMRPINEAGTEEAIRNSEASKRLIGLLSLYSGRERAFMWRKRKDPTMGVKLSFENKLVMALNFGNKDSRRKLVEGLSITLKRNVSEEEVLRMFDESFTERDWKFIQGVWDYLDEFWPEAKALSERVDDVPAERIEADPFVTRFGIIKGGYYPMKYDNRLTARKMRAEEAVDRANQGSAFRSMTKHGYRKMRMEGVKRPVLLNFSGLTQHITEMIHDLTHYEVLVDANRILRDEKFRTTVRERFGLAALNELDYAIRDIAGGHSMSQNVLEEAISYFRRGTQTSILGFKVGTALIQPLGLTNSMVRIGPKWVARGFKRWIGGAVRMENTARWIMGEPGKPETAKSKFMALRRRTQIKEINEVRNELKLRGWVTTKYHELAIWMTVKAQMVADIPTWLGAYEKAMEAAKGELEAATTPEVRERVEARAVALADQAVLDSQAGGQIKDRARVQRLGPFVEPFTMFINFQIARWNLAVESVKKTRFRSLPDMLRMISDLLVLYPVEIFATFLIREVIRGGDPDELKKDLIRRIATDPLDAFIGVREVTGIVGTYYDYEGPSGISVLGDTIDAWQATANALEDGETNEHFWRTLNRAGGTFFHYPARQIDNSWRGFRAYDELSDAPMILLGPPPKRLQ